MVFNCPWCGSNRIKTVTPPIAIVSSIMTFMFLAAFAFFTCGLGVILLPLAFLPLLSTERRCAGCGAKR